MSSAQNPLKPDARRQAQPAIRGYAYQIWHSLLAWLTLKDGQILVLEGAEDFDLIEGAAATTVQVKDVRKKLSLRSRTVLDGLANFLETSRRNPRHEIQYRLLTTAVVTTERGAPFGKGVAGLSLWQKTRQAKDLKAARSIAAFLEQESIGDALRDFLQRASPKSVLSDLIERVSWDTGSLEVNFVERAIADSLIAHGDAVGVSPSESTKVVGRLLRETLRNLTEADSPPLTHSQFAEIFEEETSERVARPELKVMRRAMAQVSMQHLDEAGPLTEFTISTVERVSRVVPELFFEPIPRPHLVTRLRDALASEGSLALLGSTGTGKILVAREVALQSRSPVLWTSFVDCEETELPLLLRQVRVAKRRMPGRGVFVLDDGSFSSAQRRPWEQVAALVFEVQKEGNHVVVTTARPLPPRVTRTLGRYAPRVETVPLFESADVEAFAVMSGCPHATALSWIGIILARTGGHPQLVHALVDALQRRGWPAPGPEDLLVEPADLHRERSEARQILTQNLPPNEREFVYALSLYGSRFRRDQALALGAVESVLLTSPGDSLDRLLGPWVEPVSRDYLRLSPLLSGAADAAWSPARILQMRRSIVEAVIAAGNLSLFEATTLLMHTVIGRFDEKLAGLCSSLLSLPGDAEEKVAEFMGWLAGVDLGPPPDDLAWTPGTLLVLRTLQYRIASLSQPSFCLRVIDRWEQEISRLTDPMLVAIHELALAGEVVTRYEAPIAVDRVLGALVRLNRLQASGPQPIRRIASGLAQEAFRDSGQEGASFLASGFILVAHRCRDAESVIRLLESLASLDPDVRTEVLANYYGNERGSALFVSMAWTAEIDKDSPNWALAKRALLKAIACGRRWQTPPIAVAGYTGLAAVHAEHLSDRTAALRTLDRAEKCFGDLPTLKHQRAIVHFSFEEYEPALEIWEAFLQGWHSSSTGYYDEGVAPTLGCRTAGIAAAMLGNWSRAAYWFSEGARRAAAAMDTHFVAGFQADAAYCAWRGQDHRGFITAGIQALTTLGTWEGGESSLRSRVTAKQVGHVLLWIHTVNRDGDLSNLGEPWPGMCSNPTANEEIAKLSPTPLDLNWIHLCELEDELLGTSEAYCVSRERLDASEYLSLRHRVAHLALTQAIRDRQFGEIPWVAQRMANAIGLLPLLIEQGEQGVFARVQAGATEVQAENLPFGWEFLAGALLAAVEGDRGHLARIMAEWRERSACLPSADAFRAWLNMAERLVTLDAHELKKVYADDQAERDTRLLAMVLLALEESLEPGLRLAVQYSLLGLFSEGLWKNALGSHFCRLMVETWRRHAASPAALRSPRVSVPQIRSAIGDQSEGWTKAARVLSAATWAVGANPPTALRERVSALARGRSEGAAAGDQGLRQPDGAQEAATRNGGPETTGAAKVR